MISLDTSNNRSGGFGKYVIVGAITFVGGVAATLMLSSYLQSGQRDAIVALAEQVEALQQSQVEVTRAAAITTPDLPLPEVVEAVTTIPSATAALAEPVETAAVSAEVIDPVAEQAAREDRIAEALAAVHRNKMRMLTEGVLAGMYSVTTESLDGEGTRIAIDARNARSATQEIEELLASAATDGSIALPDSVSTADGNVDTSTLLFDLVQRSLEQQGDDGVAAAAELRRQAFSASEASTTVENGQRFYTVEAGDSLAYIALQFYGRTGAYNRIYEANLNILSSPDEIQTGQRLVIPNL